MHSLYRHTYNGEKNLNNRKIIVCTKTYIKTYTKTYSKIYIQIYIYKYTQKHIQKYIYTKI